MQVLVRARRGLIERGNRESISGALFEPPFPFQSPPPPGHTISLVASYSLLLSPPSLPLSVAVCRQPPHSTAPLTELTLTQTPRSCHNLLKHSTTSSSFFSHCHNLLKHSWHRRFPHTQDLAAVITCLKHSERYVRGAAVEALSVVCIKGDRDTIANLTTLMATCSANALPEIADAIEGGWARNLGWVL